MGNKHGGRRDNHKRRPDDGRGGARPRAGRTPDLVKMAERISAALLYHASKIGDATLNELGSALRSAAASVEVEFTRRMDAADHDPREGYDIDF